MKRVLIIDDELSLPPASDLFCQAYCLPEYACTFVGSRAAAWELLRRDSDYSLILLDIIFDNVHDQAELAEIRGISREIFGDGVDSLSGTECGLPTLRTLKREFPEIPVVMLSAKASPKILLWCWRNGASYYIVKPPDSADAVRSIFDDFARYVSRELLIGTSRPVRKLREQVETVTGIDSPVAVLITGESGTGKELVARSIHQRGERRSGPMVVVNCAAIPEALIESELFGHRKGSFTGATETRKGKLAEADGGVLFLDEVGELRLDVQSKLLRALDRGMRFTPIGSSTEVAVDVQVVAATNRDLAVAVARKEFRADLYYRLNVFPIHVPPLRERGEDISVLAQHFLRMFTSGRYAAKRRVTGFGDLARARMAQYSWPGNVRELENAVEYALLRAEGPSIEEHHLPEAIRSMAPVMTSGGPLTDGFRFKDFLARKKWEVVRAAYELEAAAGRFGLIERIARRAGIDNPSDLQRTILPQILRDCPELEPDVRRIFPERQL